MCCNINASYWDIKPLETTMPVECHVCLKTIEILRTFNECVKLISITWYNIGNILNMVIHKWNFSSAYFIYMAYSLLLIIEQL